MNLKKFRSGFCRVVNGVNYVALALLFAMVVIVAVDVILRKIPGIGANGIRGSNEMTTFFMIAVCTLGIPVLQGKDGHVWVNLFVVKFPYRFRCFWRFAIMVVETIIIGLLAYGGFSRVVSLFGRSTTTDILNMPKWIFAVFLMIAFIEYFVLSVVDTVQFCIDGVKNEEPAPTAGGWSEDEVKGI
ncbi:MAG: TRAP transporter small permease [Clostridiales bacterium]|nr:TRAP transporter small permease [Clostridiales bacterium]